MKSVWAWLGFVCVTLAILLVGLRSAEEAPRVPADAFDLDRAVAALEDLNSENLPHPVGSAHNQLIRSRIETRLRELGYTPQLQSELICTDLAPGCSWVENIIAVKDGAGGDAILVTAHYDSAPIAPGAGDDLAGIAAMLEIARLFADRPTQNDIIFLFADGEEAGLRGAMAFAERHPLMQSVELVLNMEARGVSGPSGMFETSLANNELISLLARSASRPVANSLMFEIYQRMPNNTDVTIYKNADAMALNFAFSRGVALYHSSRDTNQNLSQASLAHHGDNVFTVLSNAADAPMDTLRGEGDATYIDLFGVTLLHWPSVINLPAAAILLLLVVGLGATQRGFGVKSTAWALAGVVLVLALHGLFGWLLSYPLGVWPSIHPLDHPHPWPARIALFASSVLAALLIGPSVGRKAGWQALLWLSWTLFALITIALAALLPGGAYLTLLPLAVFAPIAGIEIIARRPPIIAAHAGFIAAAYIALYHFLSFDVVFNFQVSYLKMPILIVMALPAAALAAWYAHSFKATRLPLGLVAAATLAATIGGYLAPAYTETRPRSVNVDYLQIDAADETRQTQWRIDTYGPGDAAYAERAGFNEDQGEYLRWGLRDSRAHLKPAPDLDLPGPGLRILSDTRNEAGLRTIEGEMQAGRSGFLYGVTFARGASIETLSVEGMLIADAEAFTRPRGVAVTFSGVGERVMRFRLTTNAVEPIPATLFELSAAPQHAESDAIIAERPSTAAPIQFGDHAETQRRISF